MNCRKGDLAMVVRTAQWNERFLGRIVRCVDLCRDTTVPTWTTDPPIMVGMNVLYAEDEALKPLRGDISNDEITNCKELEAEHGN